MKRAIYLVLNICPNTSSGYSFPVLGVHTNYPSAEKHYLSCLDDRNRLGAKLVFDNVLRTRIGPMPYLERREAMFEGGKLEKWERFMIVEWRI